jgi:hypothetical protein
MQRFGCCLWIVAAAAACDGSSAVNEGHPIPLPDPVCEAAAGGGASQAAEPALTSTLPASWDEGWLGGPAVFDLDADGRMEIVAGRHSVLYVWDADGALRWRAPVGEASSSPNDHGESRQYASPVVGDLDGDGNGEIAIAFDTRVAVYDHEGNLLPGWPASFPGAADGDEIRSLAAAQLDGGGALEILAVKTSDGPVTVVWTIDGAVLPGWPQVQADGCDTCVDYGGYDQNIGAADLDGDGVPEVVSTYDCSYIGIMYADGSPYPANEMFTGDWVNSVPMFHDLDLAIQGWGEDGEDRDEFTDSPPVLADLDADGLPELVLYSDHERAGEYLNRGNCLWAVEPDLTRVPGFELPICSGGPLFTGYQDNIVQVAPVPAVGNILGDARPEIVVPSYDGYVRCYGPDGVLLWDYAFDSPGGDFIGASGAAIADLSGDGRPEIVFTTYSIAADVSKLVILDAGGNEIRAVPISGRGSMSPPTVADVEADGALEIVLSLKDVVGGDLGGIQIWDVAGSADNCVEWGTARGNNLRDGQVPL